MKEDKFGNLIDEKGNILLKVEDRTKTEIYTRVVGFMRPVSSFNVGKKEEFKERSSYDIK